MRIGLTGGIGTGKSTVSEYLIKHGYPVIDADKVARELVNPGSDVLGELVDYFGSGILQEDGTLNRKVLGQIVFSDREKKQFLDHLMHRKILDEIGLQIEKTQGSIFIDAALLFETGLDQMVDLVWVVDADDEVRIQRVRKRDGLKREEIISRINAQMDRAQKLSKGNEVIHNSGDVNALYRQIDELLKKL